MIEATLEEWKHRALEAEKAVEQLAQWMLNQSIPTGHGDSMEGLLEELTLWVEEVREHRDHCRAALAGLLDAADHYCAMYQKHGGSHIHCGTAWTRMYRERVTAREALGDD